MCSWPGRPCMMRSPAAPTIAPPTAPTAAPAGPPAIAPATPPVTAPAAAEPPVVACFSPLSSSRVTIVSLSIGHLQDDALQVDATDVPTEAIAGALSIDYAQTLCTLELWSHEESDSPAGSGEIGNVA